MADGLSCIGDFAAGKSLQNAVKLASEPGWLDCCRPLPIPAMPRSLATIEQAYLHDQRATGRDDDSGTLTAYAEWITARAAAVAQNECRLRGALWCWRRLRQEYDEKPDPAIKVLCRRVRSFLSDEWGVAEPPTHYREAHALAVQTVQGRVIA
jgi:hypothetical protein